MPAGMGSERMGLIWEWGSGVEDAAEDEDHTLVTVEELVAGFLLALVFIWLVGG